MLGKTHITVGTAAALAIAHPVSAPACICAIAGGALGGWVSDVDVRENDNKRDVLESLVVLVVLAAILFAIDHFAHLGTWEYVISNTGPLSIVGAVAFLLIMVFGATQKHRSFTHSILGAAIWIAAVYLACPPLALPFGVGVATHVLLDLTNMRPVQLLWPVGTGVCFGWCSADGKANVVLGAVGLIATLVLSAWFMVSGLSTDTDFVHMASEAAQNPSAIGLTSLQAYLIGINVVTFLFCWLDRIRSAFSDGESVLDTVFTFIDNALAIAGGGLGLLLALLTTSIVDKRRGNESDLVRRGEGGNAFWYVFAICTTIVWAVVYLLLQGGAPFFNGAEELGDLSKHLPLLIYLAVVNAIAFVLFVLDRNNLRRSFDAKEIGLMLIAFAGGSAGAMLAIAITRTKSYQWHISYGVPVMLAADAVIVALLVTSGIA